ncbi:MAG: hypothetical protein QXZ41_06965 [Ignisphaera sp.]
MNDGRKSLYPIIVITLIVLQFLSLVSITYAKQAFILNGYNYKASSNTNTIYPGSRNVALTVNVIYNGSSSAYVSAGCISLPTGFSITRGYSACSPAKKPNGSTCTVVEPNDTILFEYRIDVDGSVTPGIYLANITVYYKVGGSSYTDILSGIQIKVSQYPRISIEVVDWYWSPDAYPGSQGVYLYVTLRNSGDSSIIQANGVAQLISEVFNPSSIRFQFSNLDKNQLTTIVLGPLSIYSIATPNIQYHIMLKLNATMSTDDGVIYYTQGSTFFYVMLSQAPTVSLKIVDYGIESLKPVRELVGGRFYLIVTNMDFKTIRSMTAYFVTQSAGAYFLNKSNYAVVDTQRSLGYGDTLTLYSPPMIFENISEVAVLVKLVMFGDNNGAEFWSESQYLFTVLLQEPRIDLRIASVYWLSSEVYPGTEGATLNIVVQNYDVVDVRDAVALLQLSPGFYPSTITVSGLTIRSGSMTSLSFSGISIQTSVIGGEYPVKVTLKGVAYDAASNAFFGFTSTYTVSIRVSEKPITRLLNVTSVGWREGKAYTTSVGLHAYTYLQVSSPGYRIEGIRATAYLPKEMIFENGNRSLTVVSSNVYNYGQNIYLELGSINVVSADEGLYPIVLRIEGLATTLQGSTYWFSEYFTVLLQVFKPILNITLVDYGWENPLTGSETYGASIYITIQSLSIDTIESIIANIEIFNATFLGGRSTAIQTISISLMYGSMQTILFRDIEIYNSSSVSVKLWFSAILSNGRNSYYRAWIDYSLAIKTVKNVNNTFRVLALHTSIGNIYSPLLPSSRGATISVDIVNTKTYQISWIKPEIVLPEDLKLNELGGTCLNGVVASGTCTITMNVDVMPGASPGSRNATVYLTYSTRSGQTFSVFREKLSIPITIASYSYYRPSIELISAYWGVQTPIRVLPNQRNTPFTLTVTNRGYYAVEGVYVYSRPLNNSVIMIKESSECSPLLNSGAMCSVTLYADLINVVSSGHIRFMVSVSYMFTQFGTNINDVQLFEVMLPVDEPASGKGLYIVDASWGNNWPVYPNTENATLSISIVNRWPYRISGLDLELILPPGFSSKHGYLAKTYISGPISSLQQFSASFQVSVGDVEPGKYHVTLVARYIVESGAPEMLAVEKHNITITVNDLSKSIDLISIQWIGRAPQPPEYGAMLMISVRNNYNPSMKGVLLDVVLPRGFTASETNTSRTTVPASNINILQQARGLQVPLDQLQSLAYTLLQQTMLSPQGYSFGYGDIMYFYLKLNIVVNEVGIYVANATLNYIDHWNNVRRIPLDININVLGSAKLIDVITPTSIRVTKGVATLDIGIINTGSAPLYNVYVYLIPYSSILIPQQAVKYLDVMLPTKTVNLSYTLIYNPISVTAGGGVQTYLRYMSAPFSLSIVYRDVYGNTWFFNTSLAIIVEPFIDITLLDAKARFANGLLTVSGTIANYGIASARSVVARTTYGDKYQETLIGDLDPASQSAFRIEMRPEKAVSDTVSLQILYRDDYGRILIENYVIPLQIQSVETSIATQTQQIIPLYNHYLVIFIIVVFLVAIGYILYRYIKTHAKALETTIERIES